jgi:two-component system, OmpR family, sensor histidine kinase KdpD
VTRSSGPVERPHRALAPAIRWIGAALAVTLALWLLRDALDKAHMALAFLLVVLGSSARHGRRTGLAVSVLSFLLFNFFLLPPYYTFVIADPLDWGVLVAFLATGAIAAHLLYRAQHEAVVAHQRAEEIDRLSTLGAETLNAGRAEDALQAIVRVIQATLRIAACEIHIEERGEGSFRCIASATANRRPAGSTSTELLGHVIRAGVIAAEFAEGGAHVASEPVDELGEALQAYGEARVLLLPLRVRGQTLGVLRLEDPESMRLDAAMARFAEVLAYYAALGVERVQLVAEAERVEALREADRVREALLAGISHDLRTPLTTIKALAHELRATGDERAGIIEAEADNLNALVANLLDLSRLNAGAMPLSPELVAIEELVGSALQRVAGSQADREIQLSFEDPEQVSLGRFDFAQSLRALVNLLENALKYSPPEAPVEVSVRRRGRFQAIAVLDHGPGISSGEVEQVFEPFYRISGGARDVRGTGLGLAIARRLAEAQSGTVEYTPRPGGGSEFTLYLPAAEVPPLTLSVVPPDPSAR